MQDFETFENRKVLDEADARELQRRGVLAMDPERALPRWFDGRYLAARDLTREQNYFLSRQSALGKSIGRGVVEGLEVDIDGGATAERSRITIGAGQGIAFDGAHLILPNDLSVNLADIAVQDSINARLGLSANPGAPIRARTGLFVLSLRAVEYTANETTAFPTTVTGERTTHKGDRIEAVAVTLTPYSPVDVPFDSAEARAMAEKRIFQNEEETGLPGYALPLAMLSLRTGVIEWVDVHLVRRELVASKRNLLGLGLARDQLRLAHFHQYRAALADVVADYRNQGQPPRFNADQHFRLLPPAGPIPAAAVNPVAQTQSFFPGEIEVELSIIPEDELPALIDDSFELPPIDLDRPIEERDSLSVMILAPLPRNVLRSQIAELGKLTRPLKPNARLGSGPLKPIDKLGNIRIALADAGASRQVAVEPVTEAWAGVIRLLASFGTAGDGTTPMLWYVRRRTLAENANLESALAAVGHAGDGEITDPDAPVPPEPVDPDPLSPEIRATLLRLSGFGDLAAIVEAEMRRVNDDVQAAFLAGLDDAAIASSPLATTALTARISVLRSNEITNTRSAVEAVAGADPLGMKLLGIGLLGETRVRVSVARFEQLLFFTTTEDFLERAAGAAAKLDARIAAELIAKLAQSIDVGSDDGVTEVVKAMAEQAENPIRSGGGRPPVVGGLTASETDARERAEAFVATLADDGQRRAMSRLLGEADPVARNALLAQLTRAGANESRIATSAVLTSLQGGGRLRIEQLGSIARVDKPFVHGLKRMEPLLIDAPAGTTPPPRDTGPGAILGGPLVGGVAGRDLLARPGLFGANDLSAIFVDAARSPEQRRLGLLSSSAVLPRLAAFGREATAAQRRSGARRIVAVLDQPGANAAALKLVIAEVAEGLQT